MNRWLAALLFVLAAAAPLQAATGTPMPTPFQTVLDGSGNPIGGGKVCTYTAGTTTPVLTYIDAGLSVANNPVITADSAGRFVAFLTPGVSYKFVYQSAAGTANTCDGVTYRTVDNVLAVPGSASSVDTTGTAGEAITGGQAVYLSDGSGGKTAGLWYKGDTANTYSSTLPFVGIAPNAISSLSSGSIRLSGQVTGLSSLTVGADYFVGSAGALTSTEPSNSRYLGRADSTTTLQLAANPRQRTSTVDASIVCGRLTLTTAVPVTTADVTAATTLFYTPTTTCNQITLYNGTANVTDTLTEISIAVPGTTSQMYDVWVYEASAGTPALEVLAWTNDTTRATAISLQNGFLAKAATPTRRYVGSFRTTTVSGQTEDSFAKRYVWNAYNRVRRLGRVTEATDSWTYTTATYRQANAAAGNQLDFVIGLADAPLHAEVYGAASNTANAAAQISIGQDSTSTPASNVMGVGGYIFTAASGIGVLNAHLDLYPAIGRHTYVWLERSTASGTTTWYGDNGDTTLLQSGIFGWIDG